MTTSWAQIGHYPKYLEDNLIRSETIFVFLGLFLDFGFSYIITGEKLITPLCTSLAKLKCRLIELLLTFAQYTMPTYIPKTS